MSKNLLLAIDTQDQKAIDQILNLYQNLYKIEKIEKTQGQDVFDLASNLAQKIREDSSNLGILITDNGILGSMVMNKQQGIRAGQCTNKYLAGMTRKHNNANVMVLGTDLVPLKQYQNFFKEFMENQFDFSEETPQHGKRVDKITKLEQNGVYKQI